VAVPAAGAAGSDAGSSPSIVSLISFASSIACSGTGGEPAFVSEIGAVLGAHVGPGLLGIGSVSKSVLE